jgi:tetratricopeptide (TPR) repeat protein
LGNSYIIDDFDQAYTTFKKALEFCGNRYKNLQANIKTSANFLCNLWSKNPNYLVLNSKEHKDVTEIAFYYIQKGQKTEADKVLKSIDVDNLTYNERGFYHYYKGLLTKDVDCFAESIINFKLSGDVYYRKLPLLELKKLNYPESILKALIM